MAYKRGVWRCAVSGCGSPAGVAVSVYARTPGSRRDRVKASSTSVRLCLTDARALAAGKVPEPVLIELNKALRKVTGDAWIEKVTGKLAPPSTRKASNRPT